jgi:PAS domain-containing protein
MDNKTENFYIEKIRNLEAKYEEAISLLNSTLNSIIEGILVVDLNGKIIFFNKKFLELWNIPE